MRADWSCIGDPAQWLYGGRIVLVLQAVARECRTINHTARFRELHSRWATRKIMKLQAMKLHTESYTLEVDATQYNRKVDVGVTIHDFMARRWLRGVGLQCWRQKYLKIYCQTKFIVRILGERLDLNSKLPINYVCWSNREYFSLS